MLRENHRGGRNRGNERPGRELSASPGRGIPLERNGGRSRRRRRKRSAAPVAAGIVLAVLCLTGAGLGIRSFLNRPDPEALTPGAVVETERFPGDEAASEGEKSGTDTDVSGQNGTADSAGEGTDGQAGVHTDQESTGNSTAEERLASMTLEEKAAQLFIITPEALTGYTQVTQSGEVTRTALEQYPVGGLIYFSGNLQSPEQVKAMTAGVQEFAEELQGLPLFLAIDEEGGTVARLGNNEAFDLPQIEDMAEIGAQRDGSRAHEVGTVIGGYLKEYGFNMDFAPDADVLTNPDNQVVARRSFGSDPELVAELSSQVAEGLREQGVMPVFKHFPGHGATAGDTHEGFAVADRTLDELKEEELVPFARAAEDGAECIMAAHISVPQVTGDDTPASLSSVMLTDVLRGDLGFDGLIVTDALNMGAITEHYTSGEAAVAALKAGADLLLMPEDFAEAYEGVLEAVDSGEISESRLDESVLRILERKDEHQQE